jgi:hypothetical protein
MINCFEVIQGDPVIDVDSADAKIIIISIID